MHSLISHKINPVKQNIKKLKIRVFLLMNLVELRASIQGRTDNETKVSRRKTAHLTKHDMESTHPYTKHALLRQFLFALQGVLQH